MKTTAQEALTALNAIENETKPINGHPDPGAVKDCFDTVREYILDSRQLPASIQEALNSGDGAYRP